MSEEALASGEMSQAAEPEAPAGAGKVACRTEPIVLERGGVPDAPVAL